MKIAREGLKYIVSDVNSELVSDIPGIKQVGPSAFRMYADAAAVLYKRGGKESAIPVREALEPVAWVRPYQQSGVEFLVDQLKREGGALLADDMGLGKSLQTIKTWQILGQPTILIVCPASVRLTWKAQLEKWASITPLLATTGKQAGSLQNAKVVITSYDLLTKLDSMFAPVMVVSDEMHLVAGRGAGRSRALLGIAQGASYRLGLTGTPMWSRPRDLWMLLRILFPNYRFGTADEFDYAYCGASINKWGGKVNNGATRTDELQLRLKFVQLRRTKAEVAKDLPALSRTTLWIPATREATKAREAFALKQLTIHDALAATLKGKMDEAVRLASELKRFLLMTWQKEHAYALHERLNDEGIPCEIITGDISHVERARAVAKAVTNKAGVVATIDSCNAGVDGLQHVASDGIFHALDYTPIKMAQAEARLHRIGQTLPVTWTYLAMQNSADQLVIETVVDKLAQWTGIMGNDGLSHISDTLSTNTNSAELDDAALRAIYDAL